MLVSTIQLRLPNDIHRFQFGSGPGTQTWLQPRGKLGALQVRSSKAYVHGPRLCSHRRRQTVGLQEDCLVGHQPSTFQGQILAPCVRRR